MKFLDITGLTTFLSKLKNLFADQDTFVNYQDQTSMYMTNVDYSLLEFDKTEIIE